LRPTVASLYLLTEDLGHSPGLRAIPQIAEKLKCNYGAENDGDEHWAFRWFQHGDVQKRPTK
jgi:hypothetical protein